MKTILSKYVSFLLSLTALTLGSTALSTKAETIGTTTPLYATYTSSAESAANALYSQPGTERSADVRQPQLESTAEELDASQQAKLKVMQVAQTPVPAADESEVTLPTPGTTMTSASGLTMQPSTSVMPLQSQTDDSKVSQVDIQPGRATRSGNSYIGVGGNIGITGSDSSLSEGSFAILSKIGLTSLFSFRPAVLFGNDTTILFPVTLDFPLGATDPFEPFSFAPYVGAGGSYSTGRGSFGFLLTGGIDVPLSREFTATAGLNVSFKSRTEIGLLIGIGYTFVGF